MYCLLLALPTELQLKIIKELLRNDDTDAQADNHEKRQDEPIKIHYDLINWSCTCSYFRNLLAPDIFKSARLFNNEKSGSSLNAVAKSPHHVHVKELYFNGSTLGCPNYMEHSAFWDRERILPCSVQALLSDLARFPSLEKLSIQLEYDGEGRDSIWDSAEVEVETPQQVLEAEASEAWRALMSKTYFALTQNQSRHFKHLDIRQLVWRTVSTFSHTAFHDFLSHFEQFTVSIYSRKNRIVPTWIGSSKDYLAVIGNLDKHFLNHLANVTSLSIKASEEAPLGLEGLNHVPLALKAGQMPLLTTLYLEHMYASPELIDFLVAHKDTLEELTLCDCYACPEGFATNGIYWSQFFNSLSSTNPTQLRRFELLGTEMRFTSSLCGDLGNETVRAIQQRHPGRIIFPYAWMDLYENMSKLPDDEYEEFLKGEDQASLDQLMELVERNAKRAIPTTH